MYHTNSGVNLIYSGGASRTRCASAVTELQPMESEIQVPQILEVIVETQSVVSKRKQNLVFLPVQ